MDCNQTTKLLNAYADKELSKSDTTLVEAHLAECSSCRAELDDIQRLDACMRADVNAPAELRSAIADRLEQAVTSSSRPSLKEKLGMRYRIGGLAAIAAGALIVFGVLSTGGKAEAAYARMKKAITQVTSSHLHIEFSGPIDLGDSSDTSSSTSGTASSSSSSDSNDGMSATMVNMGLNAMMQGSTKTVDVWSEGDKWKADAFGKFDASYADGYVTIMQGDKVLMKIKADSTQMPNVSDTLFKALTKATDEIKSKYHVQDLGSDVVNGKTVEKLQVTGTSDDGKTFHLLYWVDETTNLPAQFQLYAQDSPGGEQKLVATITCEFNEQYPDSLFAPGADKP